jgi:endo-1,4-beta-xylanase
VPILLRSILLAGILVAWACYAPPARGESRDAEVVLHALADFPVGVAVPADPWENSLLQSPERQSIVTRHFDSITAENAMKMAYLHPSPDYFEFEHAEALVEFAEENGIAVHGHALVWHRQAPEWMNQYEGSAADFLQVLEEHVSVVTSRFAGRIRSWDVVNEAFDDEDPPAYRDTVWFRAVGPGYIEAAFLAAHEADPTTDLYYNDYNLSGIDGGAKLDRVLAMVDDFLARGVPIDGIGFQMHIGIDAPSDRAIRDAFTRVARRGLKVRISELDISVNDDARYDALPPEMAARQASRFAEVARAYVETVPPNLRGGITVWGITDGDSWIPEFRQRADWPLLFNADFSPKPALRGLASGLGGKPAAGERGD